MTVSEPDDCALFGVTVTVSVAMPAANPLPPAGEFGEPLVTVKVTLNVPAVLYACEKLNTFDPLETYCVDASVEPSP